MVRFVWGSLLTVVAVGLTSVFVAHDIASDTALRDATLRGTTFARTVAGPLVSDAVRRGDRTATETLNSVLRSRLTDGSVAHIKVWDRSGRVLWSDQSDLIGRTFDFDSGVEVLFDTGEALGSVSDLDSPENVLEATTAEQLLEVYVGTEDADGTPILVETYWSMERIDSAQWALLKALIPLVLGGLVLFQLAMFPLAISLAGRVDRGLAERGRMVQHALSASELERHRIAAQLHDGVIQDLAGIGFALPSLASSIPPTSVAAHELLAQTRQIVLQDVDALRTMLTDLYPGSLGQGMLATAVDELVQRAGQSGLQIHARISTTPDEPLAVTRLIYRIIREAVQNVVKHAEATSATVVAGQDSGSYVVTVADDGQGFHQPAEKGHFGLALLRQTLEEIDGSLELRAIPGAGTTLEARFPAALSDLDMLKNADGDGGDAGRWDTPRSGRPGPSPRFLQGWLSILRRSSSVVRTADSERHHR